MCFHWKDKIEKLTSSLPLSSISSFLWPGMILGTLHSWKPDNHPPYFLFVWQCLSLHQESLSPLSDFVHTFSPLSASSAFRLVRWHLKDYWLPWMTCKYHFYFLFLKAFIRFSNRPLSYLMVSYIESFVMWSLPPSHYSCLYDCMQMIWTLAF